MVDVSRGRCVAHNVRGLECGDPSLPSPPFPICPNHAAEIYRYVGEAFAAESSERGSALDRLKHASPLPEWDARGHWVYYVQVGHLVKIGKSTCLNHRMRNYPPGSKLLAVEPGDKAVEMARLEQFEHLREERLEWFRPGPDLLDHIDQLRAV